MNETFWKCIFKRADGDTSTGGLSLFKQKPQSKSKNVAKGRSGSEQGRKCVSGTANKKTLTKKKKKERKQNKEKTHWRRHGRKHMDTNRVKNEMNDSSTK